MASTLKTKKTEDSATVEYQIFGKTRLSTAREKYLVAGKKKARDYRESSISDGSN